MTNTDRDRFYAERDRRTVQYAASADLNRPVAVTIDSDLAHRQAGQAALLALVEMLARAHRSIAIVTEGDPPLMTNALATAPTLLDALTQRATAIDPFVHVTAGPGRTPENAATLGIGTRPPVPAELYVGWDGGTGILDTRPAPATSSDDDIVGAATAACLGAGALFRLAHAQTTRPARINLVKRADDHAAGTITTTGPIDVGDVVVTGAGAVSHALAYWARTLGVRGDWSLVDADLAELHNTNRCLGMTAADAGWPQGVPTGEARPKAAIAADLIGARSQPIWFHDWLTTAPPRPDLYLCLANGHGVRPLLAGMGEPVLLHATTSANWTAELHRHIAGRDDCPACRLPEATRAAFTCSTGKIDAPDGSSADAALPFLSAAAGLMLAVALCELRSQGELVTEAWNHWRLHFDEQFRLARSRWPGERCPHVLPSGARSRLHAAAPRRWDALMQS